MNKSDWKMQGTDLDRYLTVVKDIFEKRFLWVKTNPNNI